MIYGIGIDVLHLDRISHLDGKWDDSFFRKAFTRKEYEEALNTEDPLRYFAGRFSMKEAVFKALNTKIDNVRFSDIETLCSTQGAPLVHLVKGASSKITPPLMIHGSISHEREMCTTIAIVEINENETS